MSWETNNDVYLWIFNVGRGSAAFLKTPHNQGMLFDISCSSEFSTSQFILDNLHGKLAKYGGNKIAQAVITHPHFDHFSDCSPLTENSKLHATLITCPHDKEPGNAVNWDRIKNRDGNKSLPKYRKLYDGRNLPLQTIEHESSITPFHAFEYGLYYVDPKVCEKLHTVDNEYGNSLSIVTYLRYGANSVLLPGDLTPLAMEKILNQREGVQKRFTVFNKQIQAQHPKWRTETCDQPSLKWLLQTYGLSVLVAPHHGLESCYSPELYAAIKTGKPDIVAISEAYGLGENQGKIDQRYQSESGSHSLPVLFNGVSKTQRTVTTKSHHILVRMNGSGKPRVFCETRIEDLMTHANA